MLGHIPTVDFLHKKTTAVEEHNDINTDRLGKITKLGKKKKKTGSNELDSNRINKCRINNVSVGKTVL